MPTLRPHQEAAVKKLGNGKILAGGVGSGKSMTAIAYYIEVEAPKDVYVITTAKKRDSLDWDGEAAKFGVGRTPESTVAGVLHVDSWNQISKYEGVEGAFFIFDEQRLVGSGAWTKSFLKIARNNRWILLSATPGDTWLDYIPVFLANGFYKNRTEFKREHVVYNTYAKFPKVDRYIQTGRLVRHRNDVLVEMPYERHTKRHIHEIKVSYDEELFKKVWEQRWHVYEDRPLRDVAELFSVMRKVVNSDSSRLAVVEELLRTHPKLIVFYNFDYELEILRSLKQMETSPALTSGSGSEANSSCSTTRTLTHSGESSGSIQQTREKTLYPSTTNSGRSSEQSSLIRTNSSLMSLTGPWNATTSSGSISGTTQDSGSLSTRKTWSWPTSTTTTGTNSTAGPTSTTETFAVAEWNGHKHEEIPKTDRWVYLVQYVAGAEGWNCIETDTMLFWSLTYSFKNFEQAQGRIDRLNTKFEDLIYYVLKSDSLIDKAVARSLRTKKSFNEARFAKIMGLKP